MIKIIQGNCLKLFNTIEDESVDIVIADPPYNVYQNTIVKMPYQRRKKNIDWDDFDKDFVEFSFEWIDLCIQKLKKNGSIFIFGGVNYIKGNDLLSLIPSLRKKLDFINLIIWHYPNGFGARRFFSNRFELIVWLTKGRKYYFNLDAVRIKFDQKTLKEYLKDKRLNPENVLKGKNPTNVWDIGRINANAKERLKHPTQKPERIIERIILSATKENDLVLDPFLGSGTTAKVCQNLNRNCIGFEINPEYIQIATKRCNIKTNIYSQDLEVVNYALDKKNSNQQKSLDEYD